MAYGLYHEHLCRNGFYACGLFCSYLYIFVLERTVFSGCAVRIYAGLSCREFNVTFRLKTRGSPGA